MAKRVRRNRKTSTESSKTPQKKGGVILIIKKILLHILLVVMGLLMIELSVKGPFSAETSEWLQIIGVFFFLPTFYTVIIYLFTMLGDSPLVKDTNEDTKKQSRRSKTIEEEEDDYAATAAEEEEVIRRKPKKRSRLGVAAFSLGTLAAVQLLKKLRK
jgi:hypothetical protein